jgi:hypothetical protein
VHATDSVQRVGNDTSAGLDQGSMPSISRALPLRDNFGPRLVAKLVPQSEPDTTISTGSGLVRGFKGA